MLKSTYILNKSMQYTKIINSDTISVISAYLRLRGKHTFLLESVPDMNEKARYSIIALNPEHEFQATGTKIVIDGQVQANQDPLQALNDLVVNEASIGDDLPFHGGAIGYVGFDTIATYEMLGKIPKDTLDMPDIHMFLYETFISTLR